MPKRYIAIDNVCAWPALTLLPDGTIIATIFNQPTHGGWEGDVECWASADHGRTWRYRGTPAPHDPATNRMNVAAGLDAGGALMVIASGWTNRKPVGQTTSPHDGIVLPAWTSRSTDAGKTWHIHKSFPTAARPEWGNPIPFGNVQTAGNGDTCVCVYAGSPDARAVDNSTCFHRSKDNGKTWDAGVLLADKDYNETAPLHLGDGRWLAACRTRRAQELHLFTSQDDGKTWAFSQPLSLPYQHPASLLRLADGRVLLTYGNRCVGQYGIDARLSSDLGKTWTPPAQIVTLHTGDLGYPSTVQLADGKLVTAYYSAGIAQHNGYHMGVQLWEMKEFFSG
jgi:hypothetical protein